MRLGLGAGLPGVPVGREVVLSGMMPSFKEPGLPGGASGAVSGTARQKRGLALSIGENSQPYSGCCLVMRPEAMASARLLPLGRALVHAHIAMLSLVIWRTTHKTSYRCAPAHL